MIYRWGICSRLTDYVPTKYTLSVYQLPAALFMQDRGLF